MSIHGIFDVLRLTRGLRGRPFSSSCCCCDCFCVGCVKNPGGNADEGFWGGFAGIEITRCGKLKNVLLGISHSSGGVVFEIRRYIKVLRPTLRGTRHWFIGGSSCRVKIRERALRKFDPLSMGWAPSRCVHGSRLVLWWLLLC